MDRTCKCEGPLLSPIGPLNPISRPRGPLYFGRFFTKHEIGSLFDRTDLTVASLGANIDPAYDEVRPSLPGKPLVDFAFGRVALKDLRQEEMVELFVIQYLVTARRR